MFCTILKLISYAEGGKENTIFADNWNPPKKYTLILSLLPSMLLRMYAHTFQKALLGCYGGDVLCNIITDLMYGCYYLLSTKGWLDTAADDSQKPNHSSSNV